MSRLSWQNFRSPAALACFVLTAAIGLGLDLWTKQVAFHKLAPWGVEVQPDGRARVRDPQQDASVVVRPGEPDHLPVVRFWPRWLHFQAIVNQGAVFGLGQGKRSLFLAVSVAAVAFIGYLFASSGRQRFYQFILGLLLAGVLGNMYDRMQFGYVRDMIYIFPSRKILGRDVFPWIFNVADSLLCVGVALIFLYSLRGAPKDGEADEPGNEKAPAPDSVGAGS